MMRIDAYREKFDITIKNNLKLYLSFISTLFVSSNWSIKLKIHTEADLLKRLKIHINEEYEYIKTTYINSIEWQNIEDLDSDYLYTEFIWDDIKTERSLTSYEIQIKGWKFDKINEKEFLEELNDENKVINFIENFKDIKDKILLMRYFIKVIPKIESIIKYQKLIWLSGLEWKWLVKIDINDNELLELIQKILDRWIENFDFEDLALHKLVNLAELIDTRYFLSISAMRLMDKKYYSIDYKKLTANQIYEFWSAKMSIKFLEEPEYKIIFSNKNNIKYEYNNIKEIHINVEDIEELWNSFIYDSQENINYIETNIFRREVKKIIQK